MRVVDVKFHCEAVAASSAGTVNKTSCDEFVYFRAEPHADARSADEAAGCILSGGVENS